METMMYDSAQVWIIVAAVIGAEILIGMCVALVVMMVREYKKENDQIL